jgi:hypothetical protein
MHPLLRNVGWWAIPSWTGDFRLLSLGQSETYRETADEKKACVLELVDVTPGERELLDRFLKTASDRAWTAMNKVGASQRQEILLQTSVAEAGKLLLSMNKPIDRTITAVKSENGKLVVCDTQELLVADPAEVVPATEAKDEKKKDKAVSATRPTPSCPQCVLGPVSRASEVLHTFLTDSERVSWERDRYVIVEGGLTGHHYAIAHRHSRLAVKFGRICYDIEDDVVVHFHDNSVPPEEEVLSAALILKHREDWLRNEATFFGRSSAEVFKNPFGNGLDGVPDAQRTRNIGAALRGLVSGVGMVAEQLKS